MKLMLPSARIALCTALLISGFYQPAHAISCPEFLQKTGALLKSQVLTPISKSLSPLTLLTVRRLNKKLAGRSIESLITENGTRLDATNLNLSIEELTQALNYLSEKGLITSRLTSVRLAYNPAIPSMSLVLFFKNLSHITQLSELDLRGISISSKALEHISNYFPNLKKLRLSVFNGRSLRALNNNYKLEFIDFSEAFIRKSEVRVAPDERLRRPNVSISDLKRFIINHHHNLKTIILPPYLPAEHENILELAPHFGLHIIQGQLSFKVDFKNDVYLNEKGGFKLNVNGKAESVFFSGFIAPNPKSHDVNELVVAHHVNLFFKNLAHENLRGQLVSPIKTVEGTYYGDVYFKRLVNGVEKGFLLSNLLSQMRLLAPVKSAWNNHNGTDSKTWKRLIDLHTELEDRGAFNDIGAIK